MVNITPTVTRVVGDKGLDADLVTWEDMANGDIGLPYKIVLGADRSVQVAGTFGTGGTITIQGSNDGTNYATLNDPQGTALAIQAASIKQIGEVTHFFRPNATAGDGTTELTVTLLARRAR